MQKSFLEVFQRYTPDADKAAILESAGGVRVRYNKEPFRVEVFMTFPERVENEILYAVEDEVAAVYQAASVRIFPTFPADTFSVWAMQDVLEEAMRVGAITRGFFDGAEYDIGEEEIVITVPFGQAGVDLIQARNTGTFLQGSWNCGFL